MTLLSPVSPFSPDNSFDYAFLPERDEQQNEILEQLFEDIILDSTKTQQIMQQLLAYSDGTYVENFLRRIWRNFYLRDEARELLLRCVDCLPNADPIMALMENEPPLFLYLLTLIPTNHPLDKKAILKSLVKQKHWKERLSNLLIRVKDENDSLIEQNINFTGYNYFLALDLDSRCLKRFITYFINKERPDCFGYIIASIRPKYVSFAFGKFSNRYSFYSIIEYRYLIDAMSAASSFPVNLHLFFKMMKICRIKEEIDHLYTLLPTLSFQGQNYIMANLTPHEMERYLLRCSEPKSFCDVLETQCFLKVSYKDRKALVENALKIIVSDKHSTKQAKLYDLILELSNRRSWISVYLLVTLDSNEFEVILRTMTPLERTKLLISCTPDSTMPEFFDDLFEDESFTDLLYAVLPFDLNPLPTEGIEQNNAIYAEPFQIESFFNSMLDMIPEHLAIHHKSIQAIPPLMIRIACTVEDQINFFLRIVPHLTDDQIGFLFLAIKPENIFSCLESVMPRLRSHQYGFIVGGMTPEQFKEYARSKVYTVNIAFLNFQGELRGLWKNLKECEEREVSHGEFDTYVQRGNVMRGRATNVVSHDVYKLAVFLEKKGRFYHDMKETLFNIIDSYETIYCSQLAPRGSLFMQLNLIEQKIGPAEEMSDDIFERIYPEFWYLITEQALKNLDIYPNSPLRITSAAELSKIGITSSEDLKAIGISKEMQNFLDRLVMTINLIKEDDNKIQDDLSELWVRFLNIGITDVQAREAGNNLINFLNIQHINEALLKKTLCDACVEILTINDLLDTFKMKMNSAKETLEGNISGEELIKLARKVIANLAMAIRKRQTLIKLQRYLKQAGLKECWETMRHNGINNLHDLSKTSMIKLSMDFYRLNELAIVG